MLKIFFFLVSSLLVFFSEAQNIDKLSEYANKHKAIYPLLTQWESLGIKEAGSNELESTKNWIDSIVKSYGYNTTLDTFKIGNFNQYNIVVNHPANAINKNTFYVIGHYDTRAGTGTNDNGSGIAAMLEIVRIYKNEINLKNNLKLVFFAGEELGLIGSSYYINTYYKQPKQEDLDKIKCVFNLDQIAPLAGANINAVYCENDQSWPETNNQKSALETDTLALLMREIGNIATESAKAERSDYDPFQEQGFTITGIYKYGSYNQTHTINDSLKFIDTLALKKIIKGAIAFVGHNIVNIPLSIYKETFLSNDIKIYPNPSQDIFHVKVDEDLINRIQLFSISGQKILETYPKSNQATINPRQKGLYLIEVETQKGIFRKNIIKL